jgi:UDP-N-acetylmuramoyl-L-alanyl-D-glutamate--2,6-diaminopimelate ligase
MKLTQLIEGAKVRRVSGGGDPDIASLTADSRTVKPGALYFAVSGAQLDGNAFVDAAVAAGAVAVVTESEFEHPKVPVVRVEKIRPAMASIAGIFYDHPAAKLRIAGVTGTNGKTTVATLSATAAAWRWLVFASTHAMRRMAAISG